MSFIKKSLTSVRILILLFVLLASFIMIRPDFSPNGVAIKSVEKNGPAFLAGIVNPKPTVQPVSRERIIEINNLPVSNLNTYFEILKKLPANKTIQVRTAKKTGFFIEEKKNYLLKTEYQVEKIVTNKTKLKTVVDLIYNKTENKTHNVTKEVEVPIILTKALKDKPVSLGVSVYEAPSTNLRKGLDLQGGTRVLLSPEKKLSDEDMALLISNMEERINVYGISDVSIRSVSDLSGNQYIRIEIAGATEEEVRALLSKQGKFEAKIANITVFSGGDDIRYVCRTAECSGIDPQRGCSVSQDGSNFCNFRFSISLSPQAAQRQAEVTKNIPVVGTGKDAYLTEKIELYLDGELVDALNVAADLKGRAITDIAISGSGSGSSKEDAITNSLENMKKLQTVLITGSLPVKLNIVKTDTISPVLGLEFTKSAIIMAILVVLAVTFVIYISYRNLKIVIPIAFTMISEIISLLGIAALIGWNLDLASIAGIIVAVGTGVDDQIIITDNVLKGESRKIYSWKEKIKSAFFVIMGAYLTSVFAMLPLFFAGAGLLKGFALTTIIGISVGVFITRPAYASIAEILLKK